MKRSAAVVQGSLALAALASAAVLAFRPQETGEINEATAFAASASTLESVTYTTNTKTTELKRDNGVLLTVFTDKTVPPVTPQEQAKEVAEHHPKEAKDAPKDSAKAPDANPSKETSKPKVYTASESAERLFGRFAPLKALRSLGVVGEEKKKEYGFGGSDAKYIDLVASGARAQFEVTAPQGGGAYLLNTSTSEVFVVPGALTADLDSAGQMLIDKRIHAFTLPQVDAVVVHAKGKSKSFRIGGESLAQLTVTPESAKTPDEFARNYFDRVGRMFVLDALPLGESPEGQAAEPAIRLEYKKSGKVIGQLDLYKTSSNTYFVKTELSSAFKRVSGNQEPLIQDADKLMK